jgi:hypothetical protein
MPGDRSRAQPRRNSRAPALALSASGPSWTPAAGFSALRISSSSAKAGRPASRGPPDGESLGPLLGPDQLEMTGDLAEQPLYHGDQEAQQLHPIAAADERQQLVGRSLGHELWCSLRTKMSQRRPRVRRHRGCITTGGARRLRDGGWSTGDCIMIHMSGLSSRDSDYALSNNPKSVRYPSSGAFGRRLPVRPRRSFSRPCSDVVNDKRGGA